MPGKLACSVGIKRSVVVDFLSVALASEGALPKLHSFPVADRQCPPIRTNLAYLVCWTFDPAFKLNRSFYMGFYRDWFGKVLSAAIQSG